ncbi:hypothetical protein BDK51DRAFT_41334 [Blyttiomyces helicus]|uniref:AB hydrolase-1 domain-containing protein n=1 Tax=Blyttiomyces helicus TaxID=388810 RepID=A0A4P9WBA8_9FUNG|nr:hypothetical protein BDK51DRAFT_41334 [Blyttiomyces helicus]|eukprot:RKO89899.1 hypothetical protein BDK51DRAFT_41334 [Blyttiomyces helicus]
MPVATPLLFFVHGFLGSPDSFCQVTLSRSTVPTWPPDPLLEKPSSTSQFPDELQNVLNEQQHVVDIFKYSYETHGEYAALTDALKREGVGRRVIIKGHSIGSLLAVDAAIALPPEVNVKGVLAFDSPFLGVRPDVFAEYAAWFVSSFILSTFWIWLAIVAATVTVMHSYEDIKQKVMDMVVKHAEFLAPIWNIEGMIGRFIALGQWKKNKNPFSSVFMLW